MPVRRQMGSGLFSADNGGEFQQHPASTRLPHKTGTFRPSLFGQAESSLLPNRDTTETRQTQYTGILGVLMSLVRHLILQELCLRPSGEWTPGGGWTVVRVAEGAGYCLQAGTARELNPGDMVVVGAHAAAVFRASQLGVLKLEFFHVLPQCLNGLLTVVEWQQLEDASSQTARCLLFFAASEPAAQRFTRLAAQPQRDGLAARSALLQLWAASITSLMPAASAAALASNLRERFRQFVGKMSEAELAVRSLTQLAGELHCSERHFSRLFREEFHISLRARQTELRLQRARQLLVESDAKIINVAYESGYRHLGLFNSMFKKRFGVTPSQWRQQNPLASPPGPIKRAVPLLALLLWLSQILFAPAALAQSTNPPARPPAVKATPHFKVEKYLVSGNTVLAPGQLSRILTNLPASFGTNVSFDDIRAALADLQSAYRERGFVTVSVGLPQQRLTNAEVKIKVTEGRLADIKVEGNRWFSTPNVLRALPSLHTNMLLNSHVFQSELDQANANRNRQIYPVIGPGPDPGTTELTLKVKDRFPLHARGELNNLATPGTPDTRAVVSAEYDNLWQLEHQLGISYTFTPVNFHQPGDYYWWPLDRPLVANYSAYYRLPLGEAQSVQQQIDESDGHFGYNEVTHQFQLPPPSGRPELTFYASRAVTDTGVQFNSPTNQTLSPLVSLFSIDAGQNVTLNEELGGKLAWPLPPLGRLASSVSLGLDLKYFQQVSYNSNNFIQTTVTTNNGVPVPITDNFSVAQPVQRSEVYYLPINIGFNGSIPDSWGTTFFNAQANFNLATFGGLSESQTNNVTYNVSHGGLSKVAGDPSVHDGYITVQLGADRQQRLYKDWTVKIHADGQWANGRLFSNEQFGMGGVAGVRGYQDGLAYGDAGWRLSVEPQTPLMQVGTVDGDVPVWLRASVFVDYGQVYLLDKGFYSLADTQYGPPVGPAPGNPTYLHFLGTGWGFTVNIGNHLDGRFAMAFPLLNPDPTISSWSPIEALHLYFAVGAQF